MASDKSCTILVAFLLAPLLCNVGCSKQKGSPSGTSAQAARDTARVPVATADHKEEARKAPSAYDLQFIDTMSRHHEDAIRIGEMAVTRAQHPELREFGGKMATNLERQVTLLKEWRDQWYAGEPKAENRSLGGMNRSMADLNTADIASASGDDFDRMFFEMMIPHHQGAILMAKEALDTVQHAELKALSQQILDVHQREMEIMSQWESLWRGDH